MALQSKTSILSKIKSYINEKWRENCREITTDENDPEPIITYHDKPYNMIIKQIEYRNNKGQKKGNKIGLLHRSWKNGPALIKYNIKNIISCEIYMENGKIHRPYKEGPAEIHYIDDYIDDYNEKYRVYEIYYKNGKIHRPLNIGPAYIIKIYHPSPQSMHLVSEYYYLNDLPYDKNGNQSNAYAYNALDFPNEILENW